LLHLFPTTAFAKKEVTMRPFSAPGFEEFDWLEHIHILLTGSVLLFFVGGIFVLYCSRSAAVQQLKDGTHSYAKFFYASFLKPHTSDLSTGQQGALESFYKAQVRRLQYMAHRILTIV